MSTIKQARELLAGDIMQSPVFTVSESTSLRDLQQLLSDYGISGAPVTDAAGHIVGVVSVRDLLERYASVERTPEDVHDFYDGREETAVDFELPDSAGDTVADVMTAEVHSVVRGATLAQVARKMLELRVHRILVLEGPHHVGLISTFDVLRALAGAE